MDQHQSAKEEIKRVADIVEVVGKFVHLKRAGQNLLGLCPFHAEKTPSFTVSPSKQIFHCFGCKKGGDVFTFWMEYHKISFLEAIRDLAERYHVSLPKGRAFSSETAQWAERASLLKINEKACAYFQEMLVQSEKGRAARKYLAGRGITNEIISRFKLGYAPDDWNGLCSSLRGTSLEEACKVGLVIPRKKSGYYDRFRGRVIFPIFDVRGRILGFGGRVLDDSLPKYMNTPESVLFHKGQLLYGLHASHEAIRQSGRAVIVEGYMDLLALKKHGFGEIVATLGTALTKEHIRLLKGYAKEAVVVFDPDAAGKAAATKTLPLFLDEEFPAKGVLLPENEDPDSFVNKRGLSAFEDLLTHALPMFDFFLELQLTAADDSVEARLALLNQVIPLILELRNAAQQSLYVRRLAEKLNIHESAVLEEMRRLSSRSGKQESETPKGPLPGFRLKSNDDVKFLNILVHHPASAASLLREDFRVLLHDPAVLEVFDLMKDGAGSGVSIAPDDVMERLNSQSAKEALREALLSRSICLEEEEIERAIREFENRVLKIKIAKSKSEALERHDLQELNKILEIKRSKWG